MWVMLTDLLERVVVRIDLINISLRTETGI